MGSAPFYVVIRHDGETARLECADMKEAMLVRQSFINYGKYQNQGIEIISEVNNEH